MTVIELAYATDKFGDETILEQRMAEPIKSDDLNGERIRIDFGTSTSLAVEQTL